MDPLQHLVANEQVAKATSAALKAVDELNWNRSVRNNPELIPLSRRVSSYASAALEGAAMPADPRQDPEDSPMGQLSQAALAITAEADFQLATFQKTPLQTWARLHSFVENSENRGRPRTTNEVVDPLHIGQPLDESKASAVLVAAIAHAEIATIAPFNRGSQLIARATTRIILQSRGVDQLKLVMPEYGFYKIGRNAYAKALISYQTGTLNGVADWIELHSQAIHIGATSTDFLIALSTQAE
jgi:hypothetical protein